MLNTNYKFVVSMAFEHEQCLIRPHLVEVGTKGGLTE